VGIFVNDFEEVPVSPPVVVVDDDDDVEVFVTLSPVKYLKKIKEKKK
jgi:hypothetical protein